MAVYAFSTLSDGQAISFDPDADVLRFDQSSISAADLVVAAEGANVRITAAGKSVLLQSVSPLELATSNVTFANGSRLLFGDNSPASVADDSANGLTGSPGSDLVQGFGGADTVWAGSGADVIAGGAGNDDLHGEAGRDWLEGGLGNDAVGGGGDQDHLVFREFGAANADTVVSFASNWDDIRLDVAAFDALGANGRFASGDMRFFAAAGASAGHDADDRIVYDTASGRLWYDADGSGSGAAQLVGTMQGAPLVRASDIWVFGTPAPSGGGAIDGTPGDDMLTGTPDDDTINGFAGNDTIDGRAGADSMVGGTGNDLYFVDDFGDAVVELENEGIDEVRTALSGYTLTAWVNNLTLLDPGQSSITAAGNDISNRLDASALDVILQLDGFGAGDTLIGGSAGNELNGWAGDDSMIGGEGDDTFDGFNHPQDGNDTMDGRAGNDAFFVSPGDVIVDSSGNDTVFAQSSWTLAAGLENLTFWNATFDEGIPGLVGIGNAAANVMDGRGGDGVRLDGKAGNDTLIGSGFADQFVFSTAPGSGNADAITNFSGDTIVLDGGAMPAVGASGRFTTGDPRFHAAAGANAGHDADDRVVYNTSTGQLWYDADGSGAAQLIATLQGGPALSASNITVENGPTAPPPGGINGTEGNDSLNGTADDDVINGLGGNDTIWPNAGDDTVIGGPGNDLLGGNAGRDWVEGGTGNDTIGGGGDQDHFVFREFGAANADTVITFASNWDDIQLDIAAFTALGANGRFASGDARFFGAAGASAGHDADDRIVYDTTSGRLWYDVDGSGASAAQLVATLDGAPLLRASDLWAFGTPSSGGTINGTEGDDQISGTAGDDTIDARGGNDSVFGGAGDDHIVGGSGADLLDGGDGNDTLESSGAHPEADPSDVNTLQGGAGNDTYFVFASDIVEDVSGVDSVNVVTDDGYTLPGGIENLAVSATGASDHLTIVGNDLANRISGSGTADAIDGRAGGDTLLGNAHDDSLSGGAGNDSLDGGFDQDTLSGGTGVDTLTGAQGFDAFEFDVAPGAANADFITDFSSANDDLVLEGTAHANSGPSGQFSANDPRFHAAPGADAGHDGDDRVVYDTTTGRLWYDADGSGSSAAQLVATLQGAPALAASDIVIVNGSSAGTINGTEGDDTLVGTEQPETINGLGGNDSIIGNEGADRLNGGDGNDTLDGWDAPFASTDSNTEVLDGGLGDDWFRVDNAGDVLVDPGGVDTVVAKNTSWTLAAGFENLVMNNGEFESRLDGIGNDLDNLLDGRSGNVMTTGGDGWHVYFEGRLGDDTLLGSVQEDTLLGGEGDDSLAGDTGFDTMHGGIGNDALDGGFGDDSLAGGAGNDTLTGNDDFDFFVFDVAPGGANADVVTDFTSATDAIQLDGTVHANSGPSGRFASGDGRFHAAAGANAGHDADDRVVYNTSTGQLWYDADGSGSGTAQLVATLQGAPALSATDILIVNGSPSGNTINGTAGNDTLIGTAGNDVINGFAGNDLLNGMDGADVLDGGTGIDTLDGGLGDDVFIVTAGDVLLDSGGIDTVQSDGNWNLGAAFENLTFLGTGNWQAQGNNLANVMTGNSGNNYFNSRAGNDTLFGMDGDDYFDISNGGTASYGNKLVDGGNGIDAVDFDGYAHSAVNANLATGAIAGGGDGGAGTVQVTSIERFIGGSFNDSIVGSAADNYLDGRGGNDTVEGGAGNDTLISQAGSDLFVYREFGAGNADQLSGFASGADRLAFDDAVFSAYRGAGDFGTGGDADDRLIYNTATGQLSYDDDGAGAHAAQLVTTLTGAPTLAASDITLI
ncbi:MAG TPA: hypothetical protein VF211_08640 [Burkholderiales bacterium]